MQLDPGEKIVAVVPRHCNGPGWSNTPVWVYIESKTGEIRQGCLQPHEQSPLMRECFDILEAAHKLAMRAVCK